MRATTTLLVLCVFLGWAYFGLDRSVHARAAVVVATWALFALGFYALLPDRWCGRRLLFALTLGDLAFATALIAESGSYDSPFVFIYWLIAIAAATMFGVRACFAVAAIASALYIGVSVLALAGSPLLPPSALTPVGRPAGGMSPTSPAGVVGLASLWVNVGALWLGAYLAACFAQASRRAQDTVREARDRAEGLSRIDWLTGLYNRRHFDYLLSQEVSRSQRYARPLTLLLIDSDDLKRINDQFGHQAGDELLGALANVLRAAIRISDTVVRYGGDEFVVLLPDTDPAGAYYLAERARQAIETMAFTRQGRAVATTVTIGLASMPQDATDGQGLVSRADVALYAGKRAGRNRVVTAAGLVAATEETVDAPPVASYRAQPAIKRPPPHARESVTSTRSTTTAEWPRPERQRG